MNMQESKYFPTQSEAESYASTRAGCAVSNVSTTAWILPESFWEFVRTSPQPVCALIRERANSHHGGDLQSAWRDALDGRIRGVNAGTCDSIDNAQRRETRIERWMVLGPDRPEKAETANVGADYRESTGDGIRDARNWAEDAYRCGDSWSDE